MSLLMSGDAMGRDLALIWSDEFLGETLDPAKWRAADDCWGGGNRERQCYTPRPTNVSVEAGLLRLTARREPIFGPALPEKLAKASPARVRRNYSSGKILTAGLASFRYGRIEVRAKLPQGQGLWPAIWMLPEHDNYGPYPQSGEIDIAEAVNLGAACSSCAEGRENRIHGAIHHGPSLKDNRQQGGAEAIDDLDDFHTFAIDWSPERMSWSVDGREYFGVPTRPPFDQRFHLIINLAVEGRWPESANTRGVDDRALPATLLVDWVRVYEQVD
jgi:beta-glucanase (GH16 family)